MNVTGKQIIQKQTYLPSISTIKPSQRQGPSNIITKASPLLYKRGVPSNIMSPAKQLSNAIMLAPIKSETEVETEDETDFVKIKKSEAEKEIEFKYPTMVGIPTINPSEENTKIHISGKYYAEVLSGRTYIAR